MRAVLLTNMVPPYRVPLYEAVQQRIGDLQILVSTPLEDNREWEVDWGRLDVVVQRTFTTRRQWRHPRGFSEMTFVHVPVDTLWRLFRLKPDVIVSAELGFRTALAAVYTTLRSQCPLIIWATVAESTEQNRGRARTILRRVLVRRATAILANGESGRRYLVSIGADPQSIAFAPYSTDGGLYGNSRKGSASADETLRLLYVGQLTERKGVEPLLAGLVRWSESNPDRSLSLRVAGAGPLRTRLESMSLPPSLKVEFLGSVDYTVVPRLYAETDISVFPTLADEWGLAANEALASGVPVLGSIYAQAVEELVEEDLNGWLFAPDDPVGLHGALDRALLKSRNELADMAPACIRAAQRVSVDRVADQIAGALVASLRPRR